MRWLTTTHEGTSIRDAMAEIDRCESSEIVVVDDENRLVETTTDHRLRQKIHQGAALDAPLTVVLDEESVVNGVDSPSLDADGATDTTDRGHPPLETDAEKTASETESVVDAVRTDFDVTVRAGHTERSREREGHSSSVRTVLVVGGAGYVGSVLCRHLLEDGFEVRILDPLLYGDDGIAAFVGHDRVSVIRGDARSIDTVVDAIDGVDAVIHLGGIVGDPASELDPQKTLEYNYHSTQLLASLCKYYQINRFLFASTCSVYGRAETESGRCTESSPLNPVSLYARIKIQSERTLMDLADGNFSPTILRMATIYGRSPRMRFDLVGNVLPAKAYYDGVIPVFGGDQYRPNVHVADAARAYVNCLTAPLEDVGETVFNVGSAPQNFRIDELATIVADCFPDAELDYHEDRTDERSYRVSFDRIADELGFETRLTIRDHCRDLRTAFEDGDFVEYTADRYNNVATLEKIDAFDATVTVPDHHEPPTREAPASRRA
ncbi:NAD-dependent epimerase/dehydratase family protein [Natrinema gelatinilyticum]|uniref:NAD-dependent epimerase/dehydratase family protein n=1 Tax=Natrinema gelatinilyticum TaxID=2961571 RepID=UPI0020C4E3DD|nr:NAD-dependent epimerase/dehydratase family protein [Natrinema gelatinilyticum]